MKLGFLGNGNMGGAILRGFLSRGALAKEEIAVFDPLDEARERAAELGITVYDNAKELVQNSEIVLLAIKPQSVAGALPELSEELKGKLLLSIVAGYEKSALVETLGHQETRILRIMPNVPASVFEGVFGLDLETDAQKEEKETVETWFSSIGITEWIDEKLFPVITGLSGGGPAYVAVFIEALADAGVRFGLRRDQALRIAAQTVYGSSKLILDGDRHPAEVKDAVCSPAGTTIEGIQALEDGNFRSTVMHAIEKSTERAKGIR